MSSLSNDTNIPTTESLKDEYIRNDKADVIQRNFSRRLDKVMTSSELLSRNNLFAVYQLGSRQPKEGPEGILRTSLMKCNANYYYYRSRQD